MLLGVTSQTGPNLGATPRSLAERARDHIRERITSGQYPPGTRIKERELSEELGIYEDVAHLGAVAVGDQDLVAVLDERCDLGGPVGGDLVVSPDRVAGAGHGVSAKSQQY